MENSDIDERSQNYYESIRLLHDKKDIIANLPSPDFTNFFKLIEGVKEKLNEEKAVSLSLLEVATDEEEISFLNSIIESCDFKLKVCNELLEKANEIVEEEEKADSSKKTIIFATSKDGIFFERDLKDIPLEAYDEALKSLSSIADGNDQQNAVRGKKLVNNAKLNGIREAKGWQVRIPYFPLSGCAYVFMIKRKKDDDSERDRREIISRAQNVRALFEHTRTKMTDPIERQKIIEENALIYDRIVETLKAKRR